MMTRDLLVALVLSAAVPAWSEAQPIGTFRWQLQPYCNVVTVAITRNGGVYRLEGTDDQCGAGAGQASVIGTAFQNPDGTIGLGLNIVASPGGAPSPVHATITLGTSSGTWRADHTIDADGTALAGVKALEARTRSLALENDDLRARLARLETLLDKR